MIDPRSVAIVFGSHGCPDTGSVLYHLCPPALLEGPTLLGGWPYKECTSESL